MDDDRDTKAFHGEISKFLTDVTDNIKPEILARMEDILVRMITLS